VGGVAIFLPHGALFSLTAVPPLAGLREGGLKGRSVLVVGLACINCERMNSFAFGEQNFVITRLVRVIQSFFLSRQVRCCSLAPRGGACAGSLFAR